MMKKRFFKVSGENFLFSSFGPEKFFQVKILFSHSASNLTQNLFYIFSSLILTKFDGLIDKRNPLKYHSENVEEKKLRLVFQSGNLRETLKSTAQLVELQAKKKGIELFVDLDPHLPKNFYTDHIRTSQIVLNLLNNAIKFTREGSVKLHVVTLDDPRWVKISVEDSGIGMSQDNIKKLFSSYTHIEFEGRQKMNPTGVGLGLNIASNLAELLAPVDQQGINVVSVPGQGSVFSFVLENKEVSPQLEDEFKSQDVSLEVADELPVVMRPRLSSKIQKDNISTSATQFQAAKTSGSEPLNSFPAILLNYA